jgi:hypothetical protein
MHTIAITLARRPTGHSTSWNVQRMGRKRSDEDYLLVFIADYLTSSVDVEVCIFIFRADATLGNYHAHEAANIV